MKMERIGGREVFHIRKEWRLFPAEWVMVAHCAAIVDSQQAIPARNIFRARQHGFTICRACDGNQRKTARRGRKTARR